MTLARALSPTLGSQAPRIAPALPRRRDIAGFRQAAADLGIDLMPWQETAAAYITATGPGGRWRFFEVAVVVSRQQGKTELLLPFVVSRLRMGRRIMHSAQKRELPREVHGRVADYFMSEAPRELRKKPRYANGQEEIRHVSGGVYRVVAETPGGARGPANDDVIMDEVREQLDSRFFGAALPTTQARPNPQVLYLSNAGDDASVVLNAIRDRAGQDPALAYLEWSADPSRPTDDRAGWLEANPGVGHLPNAMANLERAYRSFELSGNLAIWETEHLCRWVPTMRPRLVDDFAWTRAKDLRPPRPTRPAIGLGYDAAAKRASVVAAWRGDDGKVHLTELVDVVASGELDVEALGRDAMKRAHRMGATAIGYDDATDRDLARQFSGPLAKRTRPLIGKDFQNASEAFVRAIEHGSLAWHDGDHIAADLRMTSRHENTETGTFHAVKSKQDVPVTASLAAIRAYWLASAKPSSGSLQVM